VFESAETKLKPLSITNNPRNLDAFVRLIAFMSQVCICPAARCGGGVPCRMRLHATGGAGGVWRGDLLHRQSNAARDGRPLAPSGCRTCGWGELRQGALGADVWCGAGTWGRRPEGEGGGGGGITPATSRKRTGGWLICDG
jgi:hypothetical protein